MSNIIKLTDSYKVSQWRGYPEGTKKIFSYFESRGGLFDNTVFFGLQYFLQQYLSPRVTKGDIIEAEDMFAEHFGTPELFNREGWRHIIRHHDGKLPIKIKAVPEGMSVPTHNVLMTVENTDPECFWLTNYLETILSQVWYPCTVATLSREMKKLINSYLEETGDPGLIDFKLHDFGYRGTSSNESAGLGGLAHLVNFQGTDTLASLEIARTHYQAKVTPGFSIPASEHSNMTSWGGREGEVDACRNWVKQFGDYPIYACVSDSYDIYNACTNIWGKELKDDVLNAKGTLVVRPDSGVPHEVVIKCLNLLGEKFGFSYNNKRFKVLNPKVRVIQGDGIDYEETRKILSCMKQEGWSADNVAFGMGGGLLQKLNRDTQKFAFKCSYAQVNDSERDVFKSPITDSGKQSKKGLLALVKDGKTFKTVKGFHKDDVLQTVYLNGDIVKEYNFNEVRNNAKINGR